MNDTILITDLIGKIDDVMNGIDDMIQIPKDIRVMLNEKLESICDTLEEQCEINGNNPDDYEDEDNIIDESDDEHDDDNY